MGRGWICTRGPQHRQYVCHGAHHRLWSLCFHGRLRSRYALPSSHLNEGFTLDFTPNGSDHWARYSWREQKNIMRWNLEKLSEALFPLLSREDSEKILSTYDDVYEAERREIMNKKFGFLCTQEGPLPLVV